MYDVGAAADLDEGLLHELSQKVTTLPWDNKLFKRVLIEATKAIQIEDARKDPTAAGTQRTLPFLKTSSSILVLRSVDFT